MKKLILMMAVMLCALTANAQIAYEKAKAFDNTYVGVHAGVTTPLALDNIFPLNANVGITLGKDLNTVFGVQAEGTVWVGSHRDDIGDYGWIHWDREFQHNTIRALYAGLNGTANLTNALKGYQGTPRAFEVTAVAGVGFGRYFNANASDDNFLAAKTALDFAFNLGNKKAHSIVIEPGIYWQINNNGKWSFDKRFAQLGVQIGYIYHFKTSNGTHSFKTYDVGAMIGEIDRLNEELAKKPKEIEVIKYVEVVKTDTVKTAGVQIKGNTAYVMFAQGSSQLTDEAKDVLNGIAGTVTVKATASPEGAPAYNQRLSEKRAAVVADYLTKNGVKVASYEGLGVQGKASNRVAIVTGE